MSNDGNGHDESIAHQTGSSIYGLLVTQLTVCIECSNGWVC